jgi:DNA topoisomerase-1
MLGWDADRAMQVAQRLFEGDGAGHGHITYHRTDSPNMDPEAAQEIRAWLRNKGLPVADHINTWQNKNKQAQEGHEAIRPSYFEAEEAGGDTDQLALYKLIRERAIYSQLAPARYNSKRIVLTDATGQQKFVARARSLIDLGWLSTVMAKSAVMQEEDENPSPAINLPSLQNGSFVHVVQAEVTNHNTIAPPRYTMNTLTSKLEKLCIGRPATMASLLKNIQTKGTIKLGADKNLSATPLAEKCYDILYPRFVFSNIGYTAELEQALDQIASNQLDGRQLAAAVWDRLDQDCATAFQLPETKQ